jgi:hypothetical protein
MYAFGGQLFLGRVTIDTVPGCSTLKWNAHKSGHESQKTRLQPYLTGFG